MNVRIYSYNNQAYPKANYLDCSYSHVKEFVSRAEELNIYLDFDNFLVRVAFFKQMTDLRIVKPHTQEKIYMGMKVTNSVSLYGQPNNFIGMKGLRIKAQGK